MSIRFLCPHCKKVVSVKDEFAGKKGKCPFCAKVVSVPSPAPRPSPSAVKSAEAPPPKQSVPAPPPIDAEAEAAALLAGEPNDGSAAPEATIDFTCPMCDAQVHLPRSEAGKRAPCPECSRIIKVPELEKRDPANWRQAAPNLPSGAKRTEEAAPEGAWSSVTAAAAVSRESLQEAGAVPTKTALVSRGQRIVRYVLWSAGTVVVLAVLIFAYLEWADSRKELGVESALTFADSAKGKAELGGAGRSALYRLAGEYYLRAGQPASGKRARQLFEKSFHAAAVETADETERDALLLDLALAEAALGGPPAEADAGRKIAWEDAQKDLRATMTAIQEIEPRLEALRGVARRLAADGEASRVAALASYAFSSPDASRAEALGAAGLELNAAGKPDLAKEAMTRIRELYAAKEPPTLAAAAAALAVVLGQPSPGPAKPSGEDAANELAGQAEGLARKGQWDAARQKLSQIAKGADAKPRADVALAAVDLDDKSASNTDVIGAFVQIQQPSRGAPSPWLLLRLARVGARAKIAADSIQPVAALIADRNLRGRAQLAALEARLADPKQGGDLMAVDAVEAKTVAAWLARTDWARRNSGSAGVVKGWEEANRAFGLLGLALGEKRENE
jgi:hypothetical protein